MALDVDVDAVASVLADTNRVVHREARQRDPLIETSGPEAELVKLIALPSIDELARRLDVVADAGVGTVVS